MYELVTHLVEVHHFNKIGYITGPDTSRSIQDRLQAYQDVLREHAIPYDENLVITGKIDSPSGDEAVSIFFDERHLKPGVDLQAIVAFYDLIAVDVLSALQKRGIQVPNQMAVVGFDDDEASIAVSPRLTTVRLPLYEIGRWGVDALVDILNGKSPPAVTHLSAPMVIRRSCGCNPLTLLPFGGEHHPGTKEAGEEESPPLERLKKKRVEILSKLVHRAGIQNIPRLQQDTGAPAHFVHRSM